MTHIDLGGQENPRTPIGDAYVPFNGVFDGNGRTIEGLYIDSGYYNAGLFGLISGNAVVRDLTVKGSLTGDEDIGGIAGSNSLAQISNCRSVGDVSGDENVGGVTGFISDGGTVERCYHTGSVSGSVNVGGVTGWIRDDGALRDCCHNGSVSGQEDEGSVCGGIRTGSIENCYSLCPGLLVNGTVLESATLTSNYVLSEAPGGEDTLTEEQFRHPKSFMGWDYENVWSLENGVRPILRIVPETIETDRGT